MPALENAKRFIEAREASSGWAGWKEYVEDGAPFVAQSEKLTEVTTVEAYCEWMAGFGKVTAPGSSYTLHAACYDEDNRAAVFFATCHDTHTGEGGPVPPTTKRLTRITSTSSP